MSQRWLRIVCCALMAVSARCHRHSTPVPDNLPVPAVPTAKAASPVEVVTGTAGCVAFWDFVKREPTEPGRFVAHVPAGSTNDFPLNAGNCIRDYWGEGRAATYEDFPQLGRGPFGNAVRIVRESDPHFRPFLFVPRDRLHVALRPDLAKRNGEEELRTSRLALPG